MYTKYNESLIALILDNDYYLRMQVCNQKKKMADFN